ncbi:MAG: alpha/beta hydrolase [Planctomycetes bacterium]|nr:alpha/beta hydrolase [Planctomycetota bacterium]
MKSRTEKFYKKIPTSQKKYIDDFEKVHSEKSLDVNGVTWQYFDSEEGQEVLLLLHGGFVDYTMWIHQIVEFESTYRIIAPTCPVLPDATMEKYSAALSKILETENVTKINMMGYSEGGLIAQCFLRDNPEIVSKAILGHTFYPSTESRYYKNDFDFFRKMPAFLTETLFKLLAKPDKEELEHNSTEWLEWYKGWFRELKSKLTKAQIITHIDLMMDFVRNYKFDASDLLEWEGQMLITVSEDDIVLGYFDGMKRLYPRAEYHMFEKGLGAHSLALITPVVFNRQIAEFLEK